MRHIIVNRLSTAAGCKLMPVLHTKIENESVTYTKKVASSDASPFEQSHGTRKSHSDQKNGHRVRSKICRTVSMMQNRTGD